MNWIEEVCENMAVLKRAGYRFAESWEATLEQLPPPRFTYGVVPQLTLLDGDEPPLTVYLRDRLWESWHNTRPELAESARVVGALFGWDGGTRAVGRSVPAPLSGS